MRYITTNIPRDSSDNNSNMITVKWKYTFVIQLLLYKNMKCWYTLFTFNIYKHLAEKTVCL